MMKNITFYTLLILAIGLFSCEGEDFSSSEGLNDNLYNSPDGFAPGTYVGGENYNEIVENPFILTSEESTSTFSIDADGGSYANSRRFLNDNRLPPADAIRTEELVNYFDFNYPEFNQVHPISLNGEVSACPWAEGHKLVRIGIKGQSIAPSDLPASNIVLLVDVSGSMKSPDKLDLFKEAMNLFVDQLDAEDRIAIVTYAGSAGVVLNATSGDKKNDHQKCDQQFRSRR
jgi:Ca-activated chloride channel family protein